MLFIWHNSFLSHFHWFVFEGVCCGVIFRLVPLPPEPSNDTSKCYHFQLWLCGYLFPRMLFIFSTNGWVFYYPSALRAGGVLSSRFGRAGGRAGGCETCGTHISVTAWRIFSIQSSVELSRPVDVHCHGHLPICPIRACPWAKNLSNLPQIGSRLCGTHISETAGWIYPIWSFMDLSTPEVVHCHSYLPICPIWACPLAQNLSNQAALGPDFAEPISLKPLDGFMPFQVLWNCLDR